MKNLFLILLLISAPLFAEVDYKQIQDAPTLIDADDGIECVDDAKTCVASKNVKVTKGSVSLYCDKLTARLRITPQGRKEIYFLHAQGHVRFVGLNGDTATSEEATYDMDQRHLKLFKTHPAQNDPIVLREMNRLKAPILHVYLNEHNELKKVITEGLDTSKEKMLNKTNSLQTRALIYPNSLKTVKPQSDRSKTR